MLFNRKQAGTQLAQTADLMPKDLPPQVSETADPMINPKSVKPPVYSKPRTTAEQIRFSIDVKTKQLKERPNFQRELARLHSKHSSSSTSLLMSSKDFAQTSQSHLSTVSELKQQ